jgi:hypothetical protein
MMMMSNSRGLSQHVAVRHLLGLSNIGQWQGQISVGDPPSHVPLRQRRVIAWLLDDVGGQPAALESN